MVHSGRQAGGAPTYSGRQEQTACSLSSLHCELGPQGEGWQGFTYSLMATKEVKGKHNVELVEKKISSVLSYVLFPVDTRDKDLHYIQ